IGAVLRHRPRPYGARLRCAGLLPRPAERPARRLPDDGFEPHEPDHEAADDHRHDLSAHLVRDRRLRTELRPHAAGGARRGLQLLARPALDGCYLRQPALVFLAARLVVTWL